MDDQNSQRPNAFLDLLNTMGMDDPRLRKMAELMAQQSAFREGPGDPTDPEEKLRQKQQELARIEKLVRENEELVEENRVLRERAEILGSALGACPHCWGENNACPACQGKGSPGSFLPDRGAYSWYVLPAVQTIRRYTRLPDPQNPGESGQK